MYKTLKVKLYPTVKQKVMLDAHFNGYRFAYNLCLQYKSLMWKHYKINKTGYDMQAELFDIRKETPWLNACKAECIRQAALNVDSSFKSFYNGNGYPKFKSKNGEQSFYASQNVKVIRDRIKFYGNKIKFKTSSNYIDILNSEIIKSVTFKKTITGEYFISALLILDIDEQVKNKSTDSIIGIDLGIKDLIITSDGINYPNNRYLIKTLKGIKRLQRKFCKSKKGGSNRNKLRIMIAKKHRDSFNQKQHYFHQISNDLIRNNQTIVMETLRVSNMVKNHSLAKHISDVSWRSLVNIIEYKAVWNYRHIVKISSFYPSSKTCSECGNIKEVLLLSERIYNCKCCGLSMDRDLNAAINIRNAGIKIPEVPLEGVGYEPVELGSNN